MFQRRERLAKPRIRISEPQWSIIPFLIKWEAG
jgi:hypothetical protein